MNELIFDMTGSVSSIDSKMQVTTTAFEDLKSSGSLVIIKDPKIKKKLTDYYSTAQGILTVVNDNNTAIGNRFKNNDDRINAGWVYLIEKQNGFDTTLININDLKSKVFMNESLKTKLMNDALSYLGTSSRNIEHFENLQKEIEIIKATLEKMSTQMIKFFRNIRQNLLNEGKTSKYFKYAIGEIILVVIGILIALQINNWNEGRKDHNTEKTHL